MDEFIDSWQGDRFPHAWLVTAPPGAGRGAFARQVAWHVLSAHETDDTGRANLRRRMESGGHPDLRILRREGPRGTIPVSEARGLCQFFSLTAFGGGCRVGIVDSLDDASIACLHALLKLVEEPPPRAVILLLARNSQSVLPTLRSRCRLLRLGLPDHAACLGIVGALRPDTGPGDREIACRLTAGLPGSAVRFLDCGGNGLYVALREWLETLMVAPARAAGAGRQLTGGLASSGDGGKGAVLTGLLLSLVLGVLRVRSAGMPPPWWPEEDLPFLERLAARASPERWGELWDRISRLAERTETVNLDRQHAADVLIDSLAETVTREGRQQ